MCYAIVTIAIIATFNVLIQSGLFVASMILYDVEFTFLFSAITWAIVLWICFTNLPTITLTNKK